MRDALDHARTAAQEFHQAIGVLAKRPDAKKAEIEGAIQKAKTAAESIRSAKAFDRASEVLRTRRTDLDEGARLLLAQETVTADQFPALRLAGREIKSAA